MSHTTIGLDETEEEIFNYEVSDDALETAGGTGERESGTPHSSFCSDLHPLREIADNPR